MRIPDAHWANIGLQNKHPAFYIILCFFWLSGVFSGQAQTNSYIGSGDGFWDEARLWSLAEAPSVSQSGISITNPVSKTITIDSTTSSFFTDTLTISNLLIAAPSGGTDTNTLYLDNTGTVALHILDGLTIGISLDNYGDPVPGGGELISTNSTLIVDGMLGGQLEDDGTMVITGGSLITTNCSLKLAALFDNTVGVLIISNAVVQARDVGIYGGISSSGTMEVFGGTMTLSSSLTIGYAGCCGDDGYGTLLVADGCVLVVTNADTAIRAGIMTVSNASFLGGPVFVDGYESSGALVINNGTVNLGGGLGIGVTSEQYGSVSLNGGMLVVTNSAIGIGGYPGHGDLTVSDGIFLGQAIFLAEGGEISIQGGTSILSSSLSLDVGSTVYISGGQLVVTNASISIYNDFDDQQQCIVSGGLLAANHIQVGWGQFFVNGGSVTVSTGITLGDCNDSYDTGYTSVDGGQLTVTNAAGTGFIDIQNGQLALNRGTLQVDNLVMTNTCSSFIHTGGTLIVGNVILDPNAFQITSISREGNDLRVTWLMGPGQTNVLQATAGGNHGSYATNGFTDIFVVTNNTTPGTLTNYLDLGTATNLPARYYRVRLVP